jgi:hypothetical protein
MDGHSGPALELATPLFVFCFVLHYFLCVCYALYVRSLAFIFHHVVFSALQQTFTKFCVDEKLCGIPTHANRKFQVSPDHVYIAKADLKRVLEDKQLEVLLSQQFTKEH